MSWLNSTLIMSQDTSMKFKFLDFFFSYLDYVIQYISCAPNSMLEDKFWLSLCYIVLRLFNFTCFHLAGWCGLFMDCEYWMYRVGHCSHEEFCQKYGSLTILVPSLISQTSYSEMFTLWLTLHEFVWINMLGYFFSALQFVW